MEATKKSSELSRIEAKQLVEAFQGLTKLEGKLQGRFEIVNPTFLPDFTREPLEDGMHGCPWRILVCCIIRNQESSKKNQARTTDLVREIAAEILSNWPSPQALADAKYVQVGLILSRLPLGYRKARRLLDMSRHWVGDKWDTILDLPGINLLGIESIKRLVVQCGQAPLATHPVVSPVTLQPSPDRV